MAWWQRQEDSIEARREAISSLRRDATQASLEELVQALEDDDVGALARQALIELGPASVAPLGHALNAASPRVGSEAASALALILRQHGSEMDDPKLVATALPTLALMARSLARDAREPALALLPLLPWRAIARCLAHPEAEVRRGAEQLLVLRRWAPGDERDLPALLGGVHARLGDSSDATLEQALVSAIRRSDAALSEVLLSAGADPSGESARSACFEAFERTEAADALLRALAGSQRVRHLTNALGETVLHVAARRNLRRVLPLLLELRADAGARDVAGRTPDEAARAAGASADTIRLLRKARRVRPVKGPELAAAVQKHRAFLASPSAGEPADLAYAVLETSGAGPLVLDRANLRGVSCVGQELTGASLVGCHAAEADFSGARLRGARLSGAVLAQARFRDADLREADLSGCDLSGAELSGARLHGANLEGARLDAGALDRTWRGRYRVRKVEGPTESEGPDYYTAHSFEVRDEVSDAVVARFDGAVNEPYLAGAFSSGAMEVRVNEAARRILVTDADGTVREFPLAPE